MVIDHWAFMSKKIIMAIIDRVAFSGSGSSASINRLSTFLRDLNE